MPVMVDHVGMEVGDIAQISVFGFPKADPEAPLVKLGIASVDRTKPVVMCIGHNVVPSVGIIDYAKDHKVDDKIEVVGLCCTAHDMTRYYTRARVVGPISWELRFIRAGLADIVVLDEQCIRTDMSQKKQQKLTHQSSQPQRRTVLALRTAQTTQQTQSSKTSLAAKSKVC